MAYPNPVNLTSPKLFATYLNTVSANYFWPGVLMSLFAISMIYFSYKVPKEDAFATSAFITTILALVGRALGVINDVTFFFFLIMTIAGMAFLWSRRG